jgi:hypothetical protein
MPLRAPRSSPQCGALAFFAIRRSCFADKVAQLAASISASTIRRRRFSVSPTIIEIEYGAIHARFIGRRVIHPRSAKNAAIDRNSGERAAPCSPRRACDADPECVLL